MKTKKYMAIVLGGMILLAAAAFAWAGTDSAPKAAGTSGKMPGKRVLGSDAERRGPVVFDHAKHVGMAGSCAECHHQHEGGQAPSCGGCHPIDAAAFKKNVTLSRIRPCSECHPASHKGKIPEMPTLSVAYHRACIKCHREVGSVGKDPKGCAEYCHVSNAQASVR